jgi:hypothetical protein
MYDILHASKNGEFGVTHQKEFVKETYSSIAKNLSDK